MQHLTLSNYQTHGRAPYRVSLACIQCRSKHMKCDAKTPVCSCCQKSRICCVYQESRRGKPRPRKPPQSQNEIPNFTSVECVQPESIDMTNSSSGDSSPNSSGQDYSSNGTSVSIQYTPDLFSENETNVVVESVFHQSRDDLLDSYYAIFHPAHPCALPRSFFKQRLRADPVGLKPMLLVMQYIGSLYSSSVPSATFEALALEALAESRTMTPNSTGHQVQALILYSIAAYWCNEVGKGLSLLDEAISRAVSLGMNQREFAALHGRGDPVLEESWRRTWWLICITDAHFSGSTHTFPFRATQIPMDVDLPCEEESYASGDIPEPRSLSEYNMREFAEDGGGDFSSFAELVGLVRSLDTVFSRGRKSDPDSVTKLAANGDACIMGWCSLLPPSKRKLLQADGSIDEHLFRAHLLMHTYVVDIHRQLSNLVYCPVESVSRCAPPPPPWQTAATGSTLVELHTSKILRAIEAINGLLTLSVDLKVHSPFIICMISNTTVAHLSACKHILKDQALKIARERIRLNMGTLKALGECWPLAKEIYREVGVIAREILCLVDRDIALRMWDQPQEQPYCDSPSFTFDPNHPLSLINYDGLNTASLYSGSFQT